MKKLITVALVTGLMTLGTIAVAGGITEEQKNINRCSDSGNGNGYEIVAGAEIDTNPYVTPNDADPGNSPSHNNGKDHPRMDSPENMTPGYLNRLNKFCSDVPSPQ